MKKLILTITAAAGLTLLPAAAHAATWDLTEPVRTVSPEATNLGTFYFSPSIGQEEPTALSFWAGTNTTLQLNVTQNTLALNSPSVQYKLYSGGIVVGSQTLYGKGSATISFPVSAGRNYYVNVKNTGGTSVYGNFTAILN